MTNTTADNSQPPATGDRESPPRSRNGLRHMSDALLSLSVAVILVRSFAVEGYMISTGSMAPTLPGFHKRVTCPACGYEFAVGVADDETDPRGTLAVHGQEGKPAVESRRGRELAVCPNCGRDSIDITDLPRTQGDQLLVYKNAYLFRAPHRWEVIVFRNPFRPTQAYVKRVVGLSGETVQLVDGDVWIDGAMQRKGLRRQQGLRILVHDHDFEPHGDPGWQPRWFAGEDDRGWNRDGRAFVFTPQTTPRDDGARAPLSWLTYRHWIRSGGHHVTAVKVPRSVRKLELSNPSLFPLEYNSRTHELQCEGVLSDEARDRYARVVGKPAFTKLIAELAAKSHLAPVTDDYGYNRTNGDYRPVPVRDLMLTCELSPPAGNGRFVVEMTDGRERYAFTIDAGTREIFLHREQSKGAVRKARLKPQVLAAPMQLTMSLFDRQVLVAINGQPVFEPLLLDRLPKDAPAPRKPIRLGAVDVRVRVGSLKLYRDVYYTEKGNAASYAVGNNEYFVLGDNSPISADSRVWPRSGVEGRLLLGKPFLVHLPSRPGTLRIGNLKMRVRIPDFSRIRYIR